MYRTNVVNLHSKSTDMSKSQKETHFLPQICVKYVLTFWFTVLMWRSESGRTLYSVWFWTVLTDNEEGKLFESPTSVIERSWWRHQMEAFSALLTICAGNSPVPGEFPAQRPVTQSFDIFFDLRPNKRLSKQSWGWWFETLSPSLWRHCNEWPMSRYDIIKLGTWWHQAVTPSHLLNQCWIVFIEANASTTGLFHRKYWLFKCVQKKRFKKYSVISQGAMKHPNGLEILYPLSGKCTLIISCLDKGGMC